MERAVERGGLNEGGAAGAGAGAGAVVGNGSGNVNGSEGAGMAARRARAERLAGRWGVGMGAEVGRVGRGG